MFKFIHNAPQETRSLLGISQSVPRWIWWQVHGLGTALGLLLLVVSSILFLQLHWMVAHLFKRSIWQAEDLCLGAITPLSHD